MTGRIGKRLLGSLEPREKPYEVMDETLPGFMLRVLSSGSMTYSLRYRSPNGKRNRIKLGSTKVLSPIQARDKAKQLLAAVTQGEDPASAQRSGNSHTLRSFIREEYGEWLCANRKSGEVMLSKLESGCAALLDTRLGDFNARSVEKWRSKRLADGAGKVSLNRNLAYLKAALSRAADWEYIEGRPLRSVKPFKEDTGGKVRYLTPDEEGRLLEALDEREEEIRTERDSANAWRRERGYAEMPNLRAVIFADHLKPMTLLSMHTGLRRGEVFSLEWVDVDFAHCDLVVMAKTAKSGKSRHVPLNGVARKVLEDWKEQSEGTGLVFPNSEGKRFDNIRRAWGSLLDRAGIDNFRWHDLRHHFASKLVMAGVDLNTVRELLGHSDLKMTLRYAHLAPEHKAEAVERLVPEEKSDG